MLPKTNLDYRIERWSEEAIFYPVMAVVITIFGEGIIEDMVRLSESSYNLTTVRLLLIGGAFIFTQALILYLFCILLVVIVLDILGGLLFILSWMNCHPSGIIRSIGLFLTVLPDLLGWLSLGAFGPGLVK